MFHLGAHCGCNPKIPFDEFVASSYEFGWTCFQIFFGSDGDIVNRRRLTKDESLKTKEICEITEFKVYTHFPYKLVLVKSGVTLKGLQSELDSLSAFGGRIVIHPNSPEDKEGIKN